MSEEQKVKRCPVHARHNNACPICVRARADQTPGDFEKWSASDVKPIGHVPFFYQSTWPQYRKIVDGKEKKLDGTETEDTVIVEYSISEQYQKWRDAVMAESLKKPDNQ